VHGVGVGTGKASRTLDVCKDDHELCDITRDVALMVYKEQGPVGYTPAPVAMLKDEAISACGIRALCAGDDVSTWKDELIVFPQRDVPQKVCTAFGITQDRVVTARHCMPDTPEEFGSIFFVFGLTKTELLKIVRGNEIRDWTGLKTCKVVTTDKKQFRQSDLDQDPWGDWVALPVTCTQDGAQAPVDVLKINWNPPLHEAVGADQEREMAIVGHAAQLPLVVMRNLSDIFDPTSVVIRTKLDSLDGFSGAPVLWRNKHGKWEVIGMSTGGCEADETVGKNFVVYKVGNRKCCGFATDVLAECACKVNDISRPSEAIVTREFYECAKGEVLSCGREYR
jgi:hypothetical protein